MAQQRVTVVGGGLAGLAATMKLAELGVQVDLISLTPVKRSHSCCAQGGINSVNSLTRQLGDSESKHFDDTVYGGDFLKHQPPVRELALLVIHGVLHLLGHDHATAEEEATMWARQEAILRQVGC